MDRQWFSLGTIYQGPDHHDYTPLLQVEEGYWILGEVVKSGLAWHLQTLVRPNRTRDRRGLLITRQGQG